MLLLYFVKKVNLNIKVNCWENVFSYVEES